MSEGELVVVESVQGGVGGGRAPPTVDRLPVRALPRLGPLAGVEAEDAGGQDAELQEDHSGT